MRILVVNVNTTETMTASIGAQAAAIAAPGTEIVPLTPLFGPESVEGNYESHLAAIAVMETVRAYREPFDAVVQAGYGEHGREGLQELLDVPVVDITEAAASTAMFLGHRYSVVTTLDRAVPMIEDRLRVAGLLERCASVRASGLAVLELEHDPRAAVESIAKEAALAVAEDHAEVVCLGCGGMAGLTERVVERTGVPVVEGVAAAVTIAESLVRLGLTTSKVRTYAPPRPKHFRNWPPVAQPHPAPAPGPELRERLAAVRLGGRPGRGAAAQGVVDAEGEEGADEPGVGGCLGGAEEHHDHRRRWREIAVTTTATGL